MPDLATQYRQWAEQLRVCAQDSRRPDVERLECLARRYEATAENLGHKASAATSDPCDVSMLIF